MKRPLQSTAALLLSVIVIVSCSEPTTPESAVPVVKSSQVLSPPSGYTAVDLGTLGGGTGFGRHINDAGQIAGDSETAGGETHAFLWENGVMTDLGTLGGTSSELAGVRPSSSLSEAGHVIGRSTIAGDTETHAYIWHGGVMTDLGSLGGPGIRPTDVRAVNSNGQAVGGSLVAAGVQHTFLWENGVMNDLGNLGGSIGIATAINEAGQVAGRSTLPSREFRAFLWDGGVTTDLGNLAPGQIPNFVVVYGMNESGQVMGRSTASAARTQNAFLWDNGVMMDLGRLGGAFVRESQANDINELGQIVGNSWTAMDTERHAVLWDGGVLTDLGTLGGTLATANAINDAGRIVGSSQIAGDAESHAVMWDGGVMSDLGTVGGAEGFASDINESGWIAGGSHTASGEFRATLWRPSTPTESVAALQNLVGQLLAAGVLTAAQAAGLQATLDAALAILEGAGIAVAQTLEPIVTPRTELPVVKSLDEDEDARRAAFDLLQQFINDVRALFDEGALSLDDAEILRDAAAELMSRLRGEV